MRTQTELADSFTLTIPSRWSVDSPDAAHADVLRDVREIGKTLASGITALSGLYLRLCSIVRDRGLTSGELFRALGDVLPPPRISEILRVSRAPDEIWHKYRGAFFGFKAALRETRMYQKSAMDNRWQKRKVRRAAERLVHLLKDGEVKVAGCVVTVRPEDDKPTIET